MKKYLFLLLSLQALAFSVDAQQIKGRVVTTQGQEPLPGAVIKVQGTNQTVISNEDGFFSLSLTDGRYIITIQYLSYATKTTTIEVPLTHPLLIDLIANANTLNEVQVVSNGYQTIHKERATGSFVQLDSAKLNRRVSTNIISRIEDLVPGLVFNKNNSGLNLTSSQSNISIRGQSTILGNAEPLIVLDNFAYDGDIQNLNPNDVESISILKDAAAASIWGARAANGVIVITTKRGRLNKQAKVTLNSNSTISAKPDLFYQPQMTSTDFINMEQQLFASGFYTATEKSTVKAPLSPVVELLIAKRDGLMSAIKADEAIAALKQYDVRNDLEKYVYQKAINNQSALSLSGGDEQLKYYFSVGADQNRNAIKESGYNRITVNTNNTYTMLNQKLTFGVGLYFSKSLTDVAFTPYNAKFGASGAPYYPYGRLVDDNGNALSMIRDYRQDFVNSAPANGLLNWEYKPLDELALNNNKLKSLEQRLNFNVNYKVNSLLQIQLLYQYANNQDGSRNLQSIANYATRSLVNNFTQIGTNGVLSFPIPRGGILDVASNNRVNQNFRGQANFNHLWNNKHELTAIAGYEVRELKALNSTSRVYGYDEDHATLRTVSYLIAYKRYASGTGGTSVIPNMDGVAELTDHYQSYYSNVAYSFMRKYTLSASARLDQSNIFGVNTNQKGVPLYSFGAAWNVSDEKFYQIKWMNKLKLRLTYGYNGNVYKDISALTTASSSTSYSLPLNSGLPYSTIVNPPNPELRWERTKVVNFGIDFALLNGRLDGSVEYYRKNGIDLIGVTAIDPTTGVSSFTGNSANTKGNGFDFQLNSLNTNGKIKWQSSLIFSYVTSIVTEYNKKNSGAYYITNYGVPMIGKPLLSIYSYQWGGLDPLTGEPTGYLNGQKSKDYVQIQNSATPENIIYNGSAAPKYVGSLMNSLSYNGFSFSLNVAYRLGYYFRKNTINMNSALAASGGHGDFSLRWQKPGDEVFTQVPVLPTTSSSQRQNIVSYADILVAKADHIRLQDITFSYTLGKKQWKKLPFEQVQIYSYANNLGLLWKANDFGIDPDYQVAGPNPRTISIGLKIGF